MSYLGIEFGSTRIKAVKINKEYKPVSSGDYTWVSEFKNGIWTYDIKDAWTGLKTALNGVGNLEDIEYVGISGMMHGYLAFDENWNLLVPFRTWQNTITAPAAAELTELFGFNVPQRWSIAHLYQAVLNGEEHIKNVAHITTLAGYIHYMLTGINMVGIALLAAFAAERSGNEALEEYLDTKVFKDVDATTIQPDLEDMNGFDKYTENYIKLLEVEKSAIENL